MIDTGLWERVYIRPGNGCARACGADPHDPYPGALLVKGVNLIERGDLLGLCGAQGCSGATPNPTANLRHQMTALLNAERSVPAGMA